jgi:hypothetical protein
MPTNLKTSKKLKLSFNKKIRNIIQQVIPAERKMATKRL